MGDGDYLAAFLRIIMPIAYQFNPDLVLVAAGFDAAKGDPLGGCKITPAGYGQMTHLLSSLAGGRVCLLLEGGYDLDAISNSMLMCVHALLGDPLPSPHIELPNPAAVSTIKQIIQHIGPYWSSASFDVSLPAQDCSPYSLSNELLEEMKKLALSSSSAVHVKSLEPHHLKCLSQLGMLSNVNISDPQDDSLTTDDAGSFRGRTSVMFLLIQDFFISLYLYFYCVIIFRVLLLPLRTKSTNLGAPISS